MWLSRRGRARSPGQGACAAESEPCGRSDFDARAGGVRSREAICRKGVKSASGGGYYWVHGYWASVLSG